jgi:capsular polysaccharide transport system ATP-binding protein
LLLLEHIAKSYGYGPTAKQVLVDINLALDDTSPSLGILGANKSGKTTLLNIIAGTVVPDHGRIVRQERMSWPLSWRGFAGPMTGDEQVFLLARMYGFDRNDLLRFVAEVSRLGTKLYSPMTTYSGQEKDRLMQAAALGLDFECYLLDGDPPGVEKEHTARYQSLWMDSFVKARMIVVTSKQTIIAQKCPVACILADGQLSPPRPTAEAQAVFSALSQRVGGPH